MRQGYADLGHRCVTDIYSYLFLYSAINRTKLRIHAAVDFHLREVSGRLSSIPNKLFFNGFLRHDSTARSSREYCRLSKLRPRSHLRLYGVGLQSQMNATSRKFALEAVVFMLLGGVCLSLLNRMRVHTSYPPTDNVLMGVGIGFVSGLIIWSLYRMVRFVITG
jgi:hypothetical protein